MGQQQLLLLVLGIVIVGIAVVAGIQAFSEGKVKAERDAAVSDAMRIISDVQAWKLKPQAFGGGSSDNDADFAAVTFQALGIPSTALDASNNYTTSNGCFALAGTTTEATITVQDPACANTIATVTIVGTTSNDISWSYATGSTTTTG